MQCAKRSPGWRPPIIYARLASPRSRQEAQCAHDVRWARLIHAGLPAVLRHHRHHGWLVVIDAQCAAHRSAEWWFIRRTSMRSARQCRWSSQGGPARRGASLAGFRRPFILACWRRKCHRGKRNGQETKLSVTAPAMRILRDPWSLAASRLTPRHVMSVDRSAAAHDRGQLVQLADRPRQTCSNPEK